MPKKPHKPQTGLEENLKLILKQFVDHQTKETVLFRPIKTVLRTIKVSGRQISFSE